MQVLLSCCGDPTNRYVISLPNGETEDLSSDRSVMSDSIIVTEDNVQLQLSFPVFVMALMSFVGWFLFVIFGGLGIAGIPIDCIRVRLCKLSGKLCKLSSKSCELSGELCKAPGKLCKLSGKLCKLSGKLCKS